MGRPFPTKKETGVPEDYEHREERFKPKEGAFHSALNVVTDKWLPHITRSLGASHGLVLLTIERLVVGFGYRVRRVKVAMIAKKSGVKRERVYEILADLEAAGVIFLRDRSRGRSPLVGIDLEWSPTPETLSAGEEVKRVRIEKKRPVEDKSVSPAEDTPDAVESVSHRGHAGPKKVSPTEDTQVSPTEDTRIHRNRKGLVGGQGGGVVPLGVGQPALWDRKERNPTPQPSSSSSGKETRPTDDDYDEQVKRKAELVALGEDAPREPRGSEEELGGWRDLEAKAKTVPLGECDWFSELFAERFAPRLKLENKLGKLQQVHEWITRQNRDAFKQVWHVAFRCEAEQVKGTVRSPWSYFMTSLAEEWNDNIRFLAPPFTDEVLCARAEAEETAHALEVLQNLPGWPRNSEKEVSDLVVKCLWNEEYLFGDMLKSYEEYVQRIGGLGNAKVEGELAGALEHLGWFAARYWASLDNMEFTVDGRVEPREVPANTV